ncbi:tubulin-specific chaperone-like protein E [Dothidotthia symphoricarpi CBS 119687]|uniref:Tubulin-specific chaperone-like protein E n=1 Tax=Dothidotthia symphoricarpi CBS 119687 TaxID=1392245 RepID=A0A6A6AJ76_9PLEO|nr:tubulin-specific chaperone-like protein E [Dothidotthia symphoricarpi CBS 119687]KAF2131616.1 tubulin-specific chaperone-like protein E [Dothidotthia symphoricarpi CBS 119687]
MTTQFYPGKRLSFDNQLCTVRYHGQVQGTKGEWLGVEWDDPTRGKHSGEHQDIKYFKCFSSHSTAGSFIRPTRKPDTPRSFVEALKAKYASEDYDDPNFEDPDVHVVFVMKEGDSKKKDPLAKLNQPIKFSGKVAEEVGFDKIRKQLAQLEELKIIILDGLCMWRPNARLKEQEEGWSEGQTDVKDACPKAYELDLSRNLFEEWREIFSVCEQLDRLTHLRVDGNRFRDMSLTEAERERCLKAFANIKRLGMEENLLPWEQLAEVTHLFPVLSTFVASSNLYTALTSHDLNSTITDLTLEDNLFPSLSALQPLTKLPNLQRLVLKQNKICEINDPGSPAPVFPSTLSEVDMSFNEITAWAFVDKLEHVFPGLTSLRVSHNPLYESLQAADGRTLTADDGYMLTLARLGNLKTLNYSPINPKERLNAESYYLSLIAREVQFAPERLQTQILDSHPRYKWLCEEYGEPNIQRSKNAVNPNSLAARLIRIKFCLVAGETQKANIKSKTYEAEIPMSCTAYTVLGIVAKHFDIKPSKCGLIWETGDWMSANKSMADLGEDDWNSDDSEDERGADRVMREVDIVPGTRSIGTWIDGSEATVRVEIK